MTLSRDDILAAYDITTEEVSVPEWGGNVLVRGLTGAERDALEAQIVRANRDGSTSVDTRNLRARLVALSVVNEDGDRIFGDEDVDALGEKSAAALDRVFAVAQRLSGLADEDVDALTKN
jgi:hypothetical protein